MRTHSDKGQAGQALVEFASIATALVIAIFVVLELGRAYYAYGTIVNAAQEAARFGSVDPCNTAGIKNRAKSMSAVLDLADGNISVNNGGCVYGNPLKITVTYTFVPAAPFAPTITMSGYSTMVIQYVP